MKTQACKSCTRSHHRVSALFSHDELALSQLYYSFFFFLPSISSLPLLFLMRHILETLVLQNSHTVVHPTLNNIFQVIVLDILSNVTKKTILLTEINMTDPCIYFKNVSQGS